jgi:EAL domain-containing protein (putative c-di-GMP-specific phosphodiesterase class I)
MRRCCSHRVPIVLAGVAAEMTPGRPTSGRPALCFVVEEDFVFRQGFAKELRRQDIYVVELSSSSRLMDMVEEQNPDIVFINLNSAAPHECVRAFLALKECNYSGAVQLFGQCEQKILDGFNGVGAACSLAMLPPIPKPIKFPTVHRIIQDQCNHAPAAVPGGVSLKDALARSLIKFLYQPKFDLKTKTMIGVEAVARVAHPELGLLTPDQFLKGVDEDSLVKLSRIALVSAVKAGAHFQEAGIALQVAINMSVDVLLQLPVADLVSMHRSERTDWLGVILEVPERQVVSKIGSLKARFAALRQAGVAIAIDNFGCNPFCLATLNQIPFAEIKIDRSLVEGCAGNAGQANICKTIVQMAHNFGSRAVAVGISTHTDLKALSELDCDCGQGFLLGKPISMQDLDAWIARFNGRSA